MNPCNNLLLLPGLLATSIWSGAFAVAAEVDPRDLEGTAVLVFADEFDTLDLWDGRTGTWHTTLPWAVGGNGVSLAGNEEKQWYIDATHAPTRTVRPWSVSGGHLEIVAQPAPEDIRPLISGYDYVSGLIATHHSFVCTYGYYEMRAKLPAGQGLWPAFWLLPPDGGWPPELDIVELLGHAPDEIHTSVHFGTVETHRQEQKTTKIPDASADWHLYGVDWAPDAITWYFDRRRIHQVATPPDMHGEMYMVINLAVGGKWPGDPDATTRFPASMLVDYVRVHRARPGSLSSGGRCGSGDSP